MGLLQEIWEREHANRETFTGIHGDRPSLPVVQFASFLLEQGISPQESEVADIGCGNGRNAFFLRTNSYTVTALDFSSQAIEKAKRRAEELNLPINFKVADMGQPWEFHDDTLTAIIDCNTTICIPESNRRFAIAEALRVLKPGGFYLFYGVGRTSYCDINPGPEPNSTIFPGNGHFEKQYTLEEILEAYKDFKSVSLEERRGKDTINGSVVEFSTWVGIFKKN